MRYQLTLSILSFIGFISCEPDYDKGNMLVTVKHDSHTIGQATVYLKSGTSIDPGVPLDQYDFHQRADGTGQAYFKDLREGNYYISATGYDSQSGNAKVTGGIAVSIKAHAANNTISVTVQTQE